jgi:hypothetical protein
VRAGNNRKALIGIWFRPALDEETTDRSRRDTLLLQLRSYYLDTAGGGTFDHMHSEDTTEGNTAHRGCFDALATSHRSLLHRRRSRILGTFSAAKADLDLGSTYSYNRSGNALLIGFNVVENL